MIALAVGKKAMVYEPAGGVRCSEENMKIYFRDDLGFQRKAFLEIEQLSNLY
jgi:hypothetical protein